MQKFSPQFKWSLFTVLSLIALIAGKLAILRFLGDVDFEADSYLHFLQAESVYKHFPIHLNFGMDVWSKPLYTYIHGLWLALFPDPQLIHSQVLNILLFAAVSWVVYRTALRLNLKPSMAYLAAIFSNLSFLVLRSSISALTEPIFTLVFVLAIHYWIKRRYRLSGILIAISVFGRLEALLFVALWWLFFAITQKNWKNRILYGIMLAAPVLLWNFVGFLHTGRPAYLISNGYPTTAGVYGYGSPFTYLEGLAWQEGLIFILVVIGSFIWLNRVWKPITRIEISARLMTLASSSWGFVAALFVVFTVVQSFLFTFGLFGTAGLMRYFILIMPLLGLLAAWSVQQISLQFSLKRVLEIALVICLCAVQGSVTTSIIHYGGYYKGLNNRPDIKTEYREIWSEPTVKNVLTSTRHLYSNHPELVYYSGRDLIYGSFNLDLSNLTKNSVVVIEKSWLENLTGRKLSEFNLENNFSPVSLPDKYKDISIYIFR